MAEWLMAALATPLHREPWHVAAASTSVCVICQQHVASKRARGHEMVREARERRFITTVVVIAYSGLERSGL